MVRQEKPTFIFLCETMAGKGKMEWVRIQLGFEGLFVVEAQGRSGGLALLWKESDQVNITGFSQNHIDAEVILEGMSAWRLTGLYGEPVRANRRKTWDLLRHLARDSNLPWCVVGDLNNVTSLKDKEGGNPYPTWLIDGFNDALHDTGLIDMDLVGHQFTWERGRGTPDFTEVRLDRVLTSTAWLNLFPLAKLYNLEGASSDHSPIFLVPQQIVKTGSSYRFRFENAWLTDPMCEQLVKDGWEGDMRANIKYKVKACSERLAI